MAKKRAIVVALCLGGILVTALILWDLTMRRETHYYDPATGKRLDVETYELVIGYRARVRLFRSGETIMRTPISQYLARRARTTGHRSEWVRYRSTETGPFAISGHTVHEPLILCLFPLTEDTIQPVLSEDEFIGFLRLALDPKHHRVAGELLRDHQLLSQLVMTEDVKAGRQVLKDRLGHFWSEYIEAPKSGSNP